MMTDEIPDDVKRWTAKRRQVTRYHGQPLGASLNRSFRWLAEKGALHRDAILGRIIEGWDLVVGKGGIVDGEFKKQYDGIAD